MLMERHHHERDLIDLDHDEALDIVDMGQPDLIDLDHQLDTVNLPREKIGHTLKIPGAPTVIMTIAIGERPILTSAINRTP